MALPWVEALQAEKWVRLDVSHRIEALQQMELGLADQEGREACTVGLIPEEQRRFSLDGEPALRGQYNPIENDIQLDPILLSNERPPYQAVETYFHEARHAYQHYAIEHPETHDNPQQVADWTKNDAAYIDREDIELGMANFSDYRWQPLEADAREVARTHTNELYTGVFQDTTDRHQEYGAEKQAELIADRNRAIEQLGTTDYEQEAYLHMLSKYDAAQAMSEDYDYPYGYGL